MKQYHVLNLGAGVQNGYQDDSRGEQVTEMRSPSTGLLCKCGRPALMHVGKVGYCSVHRLQALKANAVQSAHIRAAARVAYREIR